MAKIQVKFPRTIADSIREVESVIEDCKQLHTQAFETVVAEQSRAFQENGGCSCRRPEREQGCGGRGWVVVWDTSDSLSGQFAEYGDCPIKGCTQETRLKSGLEPYYTKYDGLRGISDPRRSGLLYHMLCGNIDAHIQTLKEQIRQLQLTNMLDKGDKVVVVKGRKLPKGSVLTVAFMTVDSALLKDCDNWADRSTAGTWVNLNNIEKLEQS